MLLGAALALAVCSSQPAFAGAALIETTAPLADSSEESMKAAVVAALETAVRGASAMGFAWVQLRDAQVSGNVVAIQVLATDDPEKMDEVAPDPEPDATESPQIPPDKVDPEPPRAESSRLHI